MGTLALGGLALLVCFVVILFIVGMLTGVWKAVTDLVAGLVTFLIKAALGLGGLALFLWALFHFFPHGNNMH